MTDAELPAKPARKRTARSKAAEAAAAPDAVAPEGSATDAPPAEAAAPAKRTRARKAVAPTAEPPAATAPEGGEAPAPAKRARKKAAATAEPAAGTADDAPAAAGEGTPTAEAPAKPAKRTRARKAAPAIEPADAAASADGRAPAGEATPQEVAEAVEALEEGTKRRRTRAKVPVPAVPVEEQAAAAPAPAAAPGAPAVPVAFQPPAVTFQPPVADEEDEEPPAPRTRRTPRIVIDEPVAPAAEDDDEDALRPGETEEEATERRRRRRRGRRGRGRGKGAEGTETQEAGEAAEPAAAEADTEAGADDEAGGTTRRRRRRRRGAGEGAEPGPDDPPRTVVKVREPRKAESEVRGVSGSTRLEAKRQRRREGRDTRKRPAIVSESEFLARREAVERVMLVKQSEDRTQIAVLEDGILVEHYVTRVTATSYAGNVYLGKVQNVLPSMEAAFVDIGKGRNAVLYAGEVNYDASALEGRAPRIEQALKSGQQVVVQVTKDPIGHKGARLTSQISLPGRYMVYVPEQSMTGISRKLPDTERARLKTILKAIKPEGGGIIVRTAAEGASEEELTADLDRLKAQWEVIEKKAKKESAPALLYEEPDLVIRVVRDMFNEDFSSLVVEGDDDYETIHSYLEHLAPDLMPRLSRWEGQRALFEEYRVEEQIHKALDRKVSLPSGGSLVIDRTEAMTVVDVNTGKFTGKGGNLEETVTKNNLEAAEEVVRQLRLRDIGGIIVVDFIDMILESNRELVARRLKECLGRDRTKHQVAEITSLGLLQMTRKRIAQGLHETFTEPCEHCNGRGVVVTMEPPAKQPKGSRGPIVAAPVTPSPSHVARAAKTEPAAAVADEPAEENGAGPDGGAEPRAEGSGSGRRRRRGGRGRGGRTAEDAAAPDEAAADGAGSEDVPAEEAVEVDELLVDDTVDPGELVADGAVAADEGAPAEETAVPVEAELPEDGPLPDEAELPDGETYPTEAAPAAAAAEPEAEPRSRDGRRGRGRGRGTGRSDTARGSGNGAASPEPNWPDDDPTPEEWRFAATPQR